MGKSLFETEEEALRYKAKHQLVGRVPEYLEGTGKWGLNFPLKAHVTVIPYTAVAVTINTNVWHHTQSDEEYIDFERELVDFKDEGNSSVDMRLSFCLATRTAYISLLRKNNDGNTQELGDQINVSWDEGRRHLEGNPGLLTHLES